MFYQYGKNKISLIKHKIQKFLLKRKMKNFDFARYYHLSLLFHILCDKKISFSYGDLYEIPYPSRVYQYVSVLIRKFSILCGDTTIILCIKISSTNTDGLYNVETMMNESTFWSKNFISLDKTIKIYRLFVTSEDI